jgi:hypothetical protein
MIKNISVAQAIQIVRYTTIISPLHFIPHHLDMPRQPLKFHFLLSACLVCNSGYSRLLLTPDSEKIEGIMEGGPDGLRRAFRIFDANMNGSIS